MPGEPGRFGPPGKDVRHVTSNNRSQKSLSIMCHHCRDWPVNQEIQVHRVYRGEREFPETMYSNVLVPHGVGFHCCMCVQGSAGPPGEPGEKGDPGEPGISVSAVHIHHRHRHSYT